MNDPKWYVRFPERPDLDPDEESHKVEHWERGFEQDQEDKP